MRKTVLFGSAGVLAMMGAAWAASSGGLVRTGPGTILLPPTAASSPAPAVQPTPTPAPPQVAASDEDAALIADSYICVFRNGAVDRGSERAEAVRAAQAGGGTVRHAYQHALQGFSLRISARGLAQMKARNPKIEYCEADQIATIIDPVEAQAKPGGGSAPQPAQVTPPGITAVGGGVAGATGRAWVIDTGINLNHPDLDVDKGRSVSKILTEPSPEDQNGHGTHVAGTIGAIGNNGIGVVGVAAGAKVVAVKVLNRRGSGAYSDVIAGVDHVAANGVAGDVANMSLGGPKSPALETAVVNASAKVKFALAAGNEAVNASTRSPAGVDGPNIYTIAAYSVNPSDFTTGTWASFSNFGQPPVDYAEPGVSIYSTWKGGGYNTISGTSMAAPHMAGILLLGSPRSGGTVTRPGGEIYDIGVH